MTNNEITQLLAERARLERIISNQADTIAALLEENCHLRQKVRDFVRLYSTIQDWPGEEE